MLVIRQIRHWFTAFVISQSHLIDALQKLDTQSFGILRAKSGLTRGKC